MTNLNETYFKWLYELVGNQRRSYRKLCYEIHAKPFRWLVPNDDNRLDDGLCLRDEFLEVSESKGYSQQDIRRFLRVGCTTFEVLVALAQRIEFLMDDLDPKKNRTSRWFWEMVRNLGLDDYTDLKGNLDGFDPETDVEIDHILDVFLDRTYDSYGNSSLFPMKRRPPSNMAKVEIWYQLMLYLDENYVR